MINHILKVWYLCFKKQSECFLHHRQLQWYDLNTQSGEWQIVKNCSSSAIFFPPRLTDFLKYLCYIWCSVFKLCPFWTLNLFPAFSQSKKGKQNNGSVSNQHSSQQGCIQNFTVLICKWMPGHEKKWIEVFWPVWNHTK